MDSFTVEYKKVFNVFAAADFIRRLFYFFIAGDRRPYMQVGREMTFCKKGVKVPI